MMSALILESSHTTSNETIAQSPLLLLDLREVKRRVNDTDTIQDTIHEAHDVTECKIIMCDVIRK